MPEQMSLEIYKQKVRECLKGNQQNFTPACDKLMTLYEDEFQQFLKDN